MTVGVQQHQVVRCVAPAVGSPKKMVDVPTILQGQRLAAHQTLAVLLCPKDTRRPATGQGASVPQSIIDQSEASNRTCNLFGALSARLCPTPGQIADDFADALVVEEHWHSAWPNKDRQSLADG